MVIWLTMPMAYGQVGAECHDIYQFHDIGWGEPVGAAGRSARDLVASWPTPPVAVVPVADALLDRHPWFLRHLNWRWAIAAHPRRAPVRVTSTDPVTCPEMVVLPLIGTAESHGGIALGARGDADAAAWGADPGGMDLPWMYWTSQLRILDDGQTALWLAIRPTERELRTWPDEVDQALQGLFEPAEPLSTEPGKPTLQFGLSQRGRATSLGLSYALDVGDAIASGALPGGYVMTSWP